MEEISSFSEEEDNKVISPMVIKGLVKILEAVILNTARIMKKIEISVKRDLAIEELNTDSAKQLKNNVFTIIGDSQ